MGKRSRSVKAVVRSSSTNSNQSWVHKDAMAAPVKIKSLECELQAAKKAAATEGTKVVLAGKALRKKDKNITHLQHELEETKTQLTEAAKKGSGIKKLERKLEEMKEKMRARETELQSETEVHKNEIGELKAQIAQMADEKTEEATRHADEAEKLKQKLNKANTETAKKKKTIASLKQSNEELQETVSQLEDTVTNSSSNTEMTEKKLQHMATKINTANDEIAELKTELAAVKDAKAKEETRHTASMKKLNAELERLQHAETELGDARSKNKALGEQLKAASEKIEENKNTIDRLTDEQEVLVRSNEEQQAELDRLNQLAETTAEIVTEAKKLGDQVKELKKEARVKAKKIEQLEKNAENDKALIEKLGEEKAERDAMIKEMSASGTSVRARDEEELTNTIERARSILSVESPRFTAPPSALGYVDAALETPTPVMHKQASISRSCTPAREVVREKTPAGVRTPCTPRLKNMSQVTVSERRIARPEVDDDDYSVHIPVTTPKGHTAPCLYAQTPSKQDKELYKAVLDEQVAIKRAKEHKRKSDQCGDFFKFGAAGSGAPIRNSHNEVVTNVTFTRSTNYLPVDHPMSAKKKKPRHF